MNSASYQSSVDVCRPVPPFVSATAEKLSKIARPSGQASEAKAFTFSEKSNDGSGNGSRSGRPVTPTMGAADGGKSRIFRTMSRNRFNKK